MKTSDLTVDNFFMTLGSELAESRNKHPDNIHQLISFNKEAGELNEAILVYLDDQSNTKYENIFVKSISLVVQALRITTEGDTSFSTNFTTQDLGLGFSIDSKTKDMVADIINQYSNMAGLFGDSSLTILRFNAHCGRINKAALQSEELGNAELCFYEECVSAAALALIIAIEGDKTFSLNP